MINKIIPGLIPTFDVALASKYEPKNCDFENERWFASRKLDGVRCIIRKEGNKINAFSRAGKEFTTLDKEPPVSVTVTSPTTLVTQEPGESKLKVK